jgi:hypothetical protein
MVALCIGLVLLVIPGLILMVTLFFFWYFILLEDQGAVASLKSSHALVWGGNFWRTVAVVTVAAVIYLVALFAIGGTLGLLIGVSMFDDPTPEELAAGPGMALLVFATVQVVLNTVLLPMWTSLTLVLYRDLQLRRAAAA